MGGWRTRSDDDLSATVVVMIICDSRKNASALKRWRGRPYAPLRLRQGRMGYVPVRSHSRSEERTLCLPASPLGASRVILNIIAKFHAAESSE